MSIIAFFARIIMNSETLVRVSFSRKILSRMSTSLERLMMCVNNLYHKYVFQRYSRKLNTRDLGGGGGIHNELKRQLPKLVLYISRSTM